MLGLATGVAMVESTLVSAETFAPVVSQISSIIPIVLVAGMGVYALKAGAKFVPKAINWFVK